MSPRKWVVERSPVHALAFANWLRVDGRKTSPMPNSWCVWERRGLWWGTLAGAPRCTVVSSAARVAVNGWVGAHLPRLAAAISAGAEPLPHPHPCFRIAWWENGGKGLVMIFTEILTPSHIYLSNLTDLHCLPPSVPPPSVPPPTAHVQSVWAPTHEREIALKGINNSHSSSSVWTNMIGRC